MSLLLLMLGVAAQRATIDELEYRSPNPYEWDLPPGFPVPRVPLDNPMTPAKVALGRSLFHDARLSGGGKLACSGCHRPELAYTDGLARALGARGDEHSRSTMSLTNVAYNASYGWDDPTLTELEAQALVPMLNEHPVEMGVLGREREVLSRLEVDRNYRKLFARAFPDESEPITLANVTRALASFERTLISGNSAYDRWAYLGEVGALTPQARAGARLFFSRRLSCFRCHAGFNLSGPVVYEGADTGLDTRVLDVAGGGKEAGRLRAPSLRNVALTAPYMRDGSIATLEQVVDHYAAGGRPRTLEDPLVRGFTLSREERRDLIAFLHALTDDGFVERARKMAN
jgi:cytochrome c peroxidase